MSFNKEKIARRLKSLRADKGWDQSDLADAANVSRDSIARYETAEVGMGLDTAIKLADALGCGLDTLAVRTSPTKEGE